MMERHYPSFHRCGWRVCEYSGFDVYLTTAIEKKVRVVSIREEVFEKQT